MSAAMGTGLWTAAEVAAAVGAGGDAAAAGWHATGVSIDSRTTVSGDLFVAIKGPNFDGHDYAADALARGAVAAIVERPPRGLGPEARLLTVGDALGALADLGRAARARVRGRVIAVTGSVGKTGTKEALRTVLAAQGPVHANVGSLNNHWGLPLSLARMPGGAAFGIFEMGMNHPGEIEPLSRMARPHVALVTTVEAVHGAFFSSVEAIADAKAEIFAGVEPDGGAVLNRDNPHFERLAAAAAGNGIKTVVAFGTHREAACRLADFTPDAEGSNVVIEIGGIRMSYRVGAPGRHWVMNSLAVLAAVDTAGGDVRAAAASMEAVRPPAGRGRRAVVALAGGGGVFSLIDESYNASPASMAAAMEILGASEPGPGGRRIAVLGDMLELGAESAALHAGLASLLGEHGIDMVFTAGADMAHLWSALPDAMRGGHAATAEMLAPMVAAVVVAGDVISVKGSAGSRMGDVVHVLAALEREDAGPPARRVVNGG